MMRWRAISVLLLVVTGLCLYAAPSATISYGVIVLLHVAGLLGGVVQNLPSDGVHLRLTAAEGLPQQHRSA